jgi:hypothetical protein
MIDSNAYSPVKRHSPSVRLLAFSLVILAGCSSGDPNSGEVSGTVTIDGQPAKEGAIAFMPVSGNAPTAGGVIADGKYTAKVHIGTAKVEIRIPKIVGQKKVYDTPDSPVRPIMDESLPKKYNDETELTFDVKPGANQHDFDLSTK